MSSPDSLSPPFGRNSSPTTSSDTNGSSPTPTSPSCSGLPSGVMHYGGVPKTSISHPINISWIIPSHILRELASGALPEGLDLFDLADRILDDDSAQCFYAEDSEIQSRPVRPLGNLALSSCPGKKVRLNGPVRGRATINRDLNLDFARMRSNGITTIVCCLPDTEMEYLGAPWPMYLKSATEHGMQVLRLPIVEGGCPDSIKEIDDVISVVNERIWQGDNVLAHCRGGVGRAGLFACCWLLSNMLCFSGERAIRYARARRSPKAVETLRQAEFIIRYAQHIARWMREGPHRLPFRFHRPLQPLPCDADTETQASSPASDTSLQMCHTDYTLSVPSLNAISSLEQSILHESLTFKPSRPSFMAQIAPSPDFIELDVARETTLSTLTATPTFTPTSTPTSTSTPSSPPASASASTTATPHIDRNT